MGLGVVLRKGQRADQVSVLFTLPACAWIELSRSLSVLRPQGHPNQRRTWIKMPSMPDECARNFLLAVVQSPQIPGALVGQRRSETGPAHFVPGAVRLNAPSTDHGSTRVFSVFSHLHQSTEARVRGRWNVAIWHPDLYASQVVFVRNWKGAILEWVITIMDGYRQQQPHAR